VSGLPYEQERIHAAAIYCSDGRLGNHVDDFLQVGLGLPRYDRLACPGGPVCLAGRLSAHWEAQGMEEQLRFLAQVHEIEKVVLIAHRECAYYAGRLAIPLERAEAEQQDDLQKAMYTVQRIVRGAAVTRFMARVSGTEVSFTPV
jgi:hypothetical protein